MSTVKRYGFARHERLTRPSEFDRVCKYGQAFRTKELVIMGLPNGMSCSRLGMVVGRRLGSAVVRSRVKRLIRESFRLNKHLLSKGYDIVVVARADWKDARLATIEPHFQRFFEMLSKGEKKS